MLLRVTSSSGPGRGTPPPSTSRGPEAPPVPEGVEGVPVGRPLARPLSTEGWTTEVEGLGAEDRSEYGRGSSGKSSEEGVRETCGEDGRRRGRSRG